jgi:hypothetical protein
MLTDHPSHQTFSHLLNNPATSSPTSFHDPSSTRRLERTRRNLGAQRHDLLVALRVVNRIEKEVVEAEYEHWLLDETHKCAKVGSMLDGEKKNDQTVQAWVRGYCADCEESLNLVKEGRRGLV